MNDQLPDRTVLLIILATLLLVFFLAFSFKSNKIEQERNQDIALLLESWVPLKEEIEKIDKREESYRMKGYEW